MPFKQAPYSKVKGWGMALAILLLAYSSAHAQTPMEESAPFVQQFNSAGNPLNFSEYKVEMWDGKNRLNEGTLHLKTLSGEVLQTWELSECPIVKIGFQTFPLEAFILEWELEIFPIVNGELRIPSHTSRHHFIFSGLGTEEQRGEAEVEMDAAEIHWNILYLQLDRSMERRVLQGSPMYRRFRVTQCRKGTPIKIYIDGIPAGSQYSSLIQTQNK